MRVQEINLGVGNGKANGDKVLTIALASAVEDTDGSFSWSVGIVQLSCHALKETLLEFVWQCFSTTSDVLQAGTGIKFL